MVLRFPRRFRFNQYYLAPLSPADHRSETFRTIRENLIQTPSSPSGTGSNSDYLLKTAHFGHQLNSLLGEPFRIVGSSQESEALTYRVGGLCYFLSASLHEI